VFLTLLNMAEIQTHCLMPRTPHASNTPEALDHVFPSSARAGGLPQPLRLLGGEPVS